MLKKNLPFVKKRLTRMMVKQAITGPLNNVLKDAFGFSSGKNNEPTKNNARGGYISGAGTGTSDSIPARLSNGEFVVNAKATKRFRPVLEDINRSIPAFAMGGFVGKDHFAPLMKHLKADTLAPKVINFPVPPSFHARREKAFKNQESYLKPVQTQVKIHLINKTQTPVNAKTQDDGSGNIRVILEEVDKGIAKGIAQESSATSTVLKNMYGLKKRGE